MSEGWEKRDWGSGIRTWRKISGSIRRYPKRSKGPSQYSIRVVKTVRRKQLIKSGVV